MRASLLSAILPILVSALAAASARADCCLVAKVDAESPAIPVRVCTPDAAGDACGQELFLGTLELGESQEVCPPAATLVYQEWDATLEAFGPPVVAVCNADVDVEL